MNIDELKKLLVASWTKETCFPGLKDYWSKQNPSLGQCAVTSLIVNDYYGGKIMRCMTSSGSHYYNLVNNEIIDLTKEQFLNEEPDYINSEERTREYILSNTDTKDRYLLLKDNLNKKRGDSY